MRAPMTSLMQQHGLPLHMLQRFDAGNPAIQRAAHAWERRLPSVNYFDRPVNIIVVGQRGLRR